MGLTSKVVLAAIIATTIVGCATLGHATSVSESLTDLAMDTDEINAAPSSPSSLNNNEEGGEEPQQSEDAKRYVSSDAYDDLSHIAHEQRPPAKPVENMPCHVLTGGAMIPFAKVRKELMSLLKDMARGGGGGKMTTSADGKKSKLEDSDEIPTTIRSYTCPQARVTELSRLVKSIGSHEVLDQWSVDLREAAIANFARLGNECSVDILQLSDVLHHWASEMQGMAFALEHAAENCDQSWAHFLAFITAGDKLSVPQFRNEKCMFIDEYRSCFDVKRPSADE